MFRKKDIIRREGTDTICLRCSRSDWLRQNKIGREKEDTVGREVYGEDELGCRKAACSGSAGAQSRRRSESQGLHAGAQDDAKQPKELLKSVLAAASRLQQHEVNWKREGHDWDAEAVQLVHVEARDRELARTAPRSDGGVCSNRHPGEEDRGAPPDGWKPEHGRRRRPGFAPGRDQSRDEWTDRYGIEASNLERVSTRVCLNA